MSKCTHTCREEIVTKHNLPQVFINEPDNKDVLYEEPSAKYKPNARMISWKTSAERLPWWLAAIETRYCKMGNCIVNWLDLRNLNKNLIQIEISTAAGKKFTIKIHLTTGCITCQGLNYLWFKDSEFAKLLNFVKHYAKQAENPDPEVTFLNENHVEEVEPAESSNQFDYLKIENNRLRQEIADKNSEIKSLTLKIQESVATVNQLESLNVENRSLRQEITDKNSVIQALTLNMQETEDENNTLKEQLLTAGLVPTPATQKNIPQNMEANNEDVASGGSRISALVTKDEFEDCFAISNKYGKSRPEWPRKTILMYKITLDDVEVNNRIGLLKYWQKVDNLPNSPSKKAKHAEIVMLDTINKKIDIGGSGEPLTDLKLEMYINYSPCNECADRLIKFQERQKSHISLQFANFYKDYETKNIKGLTDMINNDIELSIFYGESDWKRFLLDASVDDVTKKECLKVAAKKGRTARETVDAMKIKKYNEDAEMERITAQLAKTTIKK